MSNDYLKHIIDEAESQIQQLVYELVYDLELTRKDPESSYYYDLLSRDQKFRKVMQKIYESTHKGFERGYKRLINKK
jgi:hypothetical protein